MAGSTSGWRSLLRTTTAAGAALFRLGLDAFCFAL
jgi:hypothetical protein